MHLRYQLAAQLRAREVDRPLVVRRPDGALGVLEECAGAANLHVYNMYKNVYVLIPCKSPIFVRTRSLLILSTFINLLMESICGTIQDKRQ